MKKQPKMAVSTRDQLMQFVEDTKNGAYTYEKPQVVEVTFFRQEHAIAPPVIVPEDYSEGSILFGISY